MRSTFKDRLIEGMEINGFRQADLAERTGLSKSRISHYVSGRYEAKQEALYLIAKALNVNEAWLMGHDVPKERTLPEKEKDLSNETDLLHQIDLHFGRFAGQAFTMFLALNREGQEKAADYISDLLDVPKYRKENEE